MENIYNTYNKSCRSCLFVLVQQSQPSISEALGRSKKYTKGYYVWYEFTYNKIQCLFVSLSLSVGAAHHRKIMADFEETNYQISDVIRSKPTAIIL